MTFFQKFMFWSGILFWVDLFGVVLFELGYITWWFN